MKDDIANLLNPPCSYCCTHVSILYCLDLLGGLYYKVVCMYISIFLVDKCINISQEFMDDLGTHKRNVSVSRCFRHRVQDGVCLGRSSLVIQGPLGVR